MTDTKPAKKEPTRKATKKAASKKTTNKSKSKSTKSKKQENSTKLKNQDNSISKSPFGFIAGLVILALIAWAVISLSSLGATEETYAVAEYEGQTYALSSDEIEKYMLIADAEGFGFTREQMAEQLLNLNILLLEAQSQGFSTDSEEVQEQIAQYDVLINSQIDDEEILRELEERGFTKDEFVAELKQSLAKDIIIQQLIQQEVYEPNQPDMESLRAFYDENIDSFEVGDTVSARHILICHQDSQRCEANRTKQEAQVFAKAVLADILAGDITFEQAAIEYSDGPSGPNGGDLGSFSEGQMVAEFEETAFALDEGEIAPQPVETTFGYHLIQVYGKQTAGTASFEQVLPQLQQAYQQEVIAPLEQSYVQSILDRAEITYSEE